MWVARWLRNIGPWAKLHSYETGLAEEFQILEPYERPPFRGFSIDSGVSLKYVDLRKKIGKGGVVHSATGVITEKQFLINSTGKR